LSRKVLEATSSSGRRWGVVTFIQTKSSAINRCCAITLSRSTIGEVNT
jgi:hypothetical protein